MSAAVSRYVRVVLSDPDCQLGGSARHLLEVLGHLASRTGQAWPSVETLADRMRSSAKTVRRARAELVAAGVIAVETGGGAFSNLYRFPLTSALEVVHTPGPDDPGTPVISSPDPRSRCPSPRSPRPGEVSKKDPKKAPSSLAPRASSALCDPDCPDCDGAGFVPVTEIRDGRTIAAVAPCPRRRTA